MSESVRLDLHVHSRYSPDGRIDLRRIVDALGLAGIHGFALTDHNTVDGHRELAKLRSEYPRYWFLPGEEVSTSDGHLLVYGLQEAAPSHRPLAETLDWVRAHGAVAALAHPFRWVHGVGRRLAESARVEAIETTNGHNAAITNARAELVAAQRRVGATGGSDAHDLRDVGRAFTEFTDEPSSVDDLISSLSRGHVRSGGASLPVGARIRLGLRTGILRAGRGFRAI